MGLQNELLASQIARVRQPGSGPGVPEVSPTNRMLIDGQPVAGGIDERPMRRETSHPQHRQMEAGANTDVGYLRTKTGYAPVMSKAAKERLEEDIPGWLGWQIRNRLVQMFGHNYQPPPVKGEWYFNPAMGEYQDYSQRNMRSGRYRPWSYMRR